MSADVIVIGGGLAGLSAALACADDGARVTLLESRPRLGGATHSFQRGELSVDNGQHVFLRCCTAYRAFLDRLGVTSWTSMQPRLRIPVVTPLGHHAVLRRGPLPAPFHLAQALATYRLLPVGDRLRAARTALALRRLDPADRAVDARTFGEWLRARGQGEAAISRLWALVTVASLNVGIDEASLALAATVVQTGLLAHRDAGDIGVAAVPLGLLHGAAGARALAAAGVQVHCSARVRDIEVRGQGGLRVRTANAELIAGSAILAVPPHAAAALLPEGALPGQPFTALGSSPIINVHVRYDHPVLHTPFLAAVDSPVQWVFDRTHAAALARGQYIAVSVSAADAFVDRSTAELRALFLPELARRLPDARAASVEDFFVTRDRTATFRQRAGTAALRPGTHTSVPGLLLAGAWTDTGWPATMEGAVRSGLTAAQAAAEHFRAQSAPAAEPLSAPMGALHTLLAQHSQRAGPAARAVEEPPA